jgi:hypothetical protein
MRSVRLRDRESANHSYNLPKNDGIASIMGLRGYCSIVRQNSSICCDKSYMKGRWAKQMRLKQRLAGFLTRNPLPVVSCWVKMCHNCLILWSGTKQRRISSKVNTEGGSVGCTYCQNFSCIVPLEGRQAQWKSQHYPFQFNWRRSKR